MAALFIWSGIGPSPAYPLQIPSQKDIHKYEQRTVLVKLFNVYWLNIKLTLRFATPQVSGSRQNQVQSPEWNTDQI